MGARFDCPQDADLCSYVAPRAVALSLSVSAPAVSMAIIEAMVVGAIPLRPLAVKRCLMYDGGVSLLVAASKSRVVLPLATLNEAMAPLMFRRDMPPAWEACVQMYTNCGATPKDCAIDPLLIILLQSQQWRVALRLINQGAQRADGVFMLSGFGITSGAQRVFPPVPSRRLCKTVFLLPTPTPSTTLISARYFSPRCSVMSRWRNPLFQNTKLCTDARFVAFSVLYVAARRPPRT